MRNEYDYIKHLNNVKRCKHRFILTKTKIKTDLFQLKTKEVIAPIAIKCKSYFCQDCAKAKKNILYKKAIAGMKNESWRMITLTTINKKQNSKKVFNEFSNSFNKLFTLLRRRYPDIKYFKVMEIGKGGMLHAHILVNVYIPKSIIKHFWKKYTNAYIVDIRKVSGNRKSLNYILKYFSKSLENNEMNKKFYINQKRHFSFSRNFSEKIIKEKIFSLFSSELLSTQKLHDFILIYNSVKSKSDHSIVLDYLPPPLQNEFSFLF